MKKRLLLLTGLLCLSFTHLAQEETATSFSPRPSVGLQVGSLGAGLQFTYPLSKRIELRASGTYLPELGMTFTGKSGGADVTSDYKFSTGGGALVATYSPFAKRTGIKIATGAIYTLTKVSAVNTYYLPKYDENLGVLGIEINPGLPVNPYLGIILGNAGKAKWVSYAFEFGAMYHGKPQVTMTGEGRIAPTANESNTAIIENNISSLQFYPYANFQLNFFLKKQ
ncbi:hypothetical protein SAMN05216474_1988 [Lishizhenia tianjinensis]|uniref:Outer membrane protein beta-barrel domain-containing protein n=1 Tax=Lishizhenia tianjinensis TaxID=477690 RepID=A0A1I7AE02_9FLAO|nr:hypothetical protein [Lishizhenia tianjinensis]SFT73115.1 hypothetical protein SAMN05216474_1988 [Lishizhenia tianjinensis]